MDTNKITETVSVTRSTNNVTVNWATNKLATGVVYYSPSPIIATEATEGFSNVTISGNTAFMDATLRNSQNVSITGLQSNNTYYYVIYTKDAYGNVQLTWPSTFSTQM